MATMESGNTQNECGHPTKPKLDLYSRRKRSISESSKDIVKKRLFDRSMDDNRDGIKPLVIDIKPEPTGVDPDTTM